MGVNEELDAVLDEPELPGLVRTYFEARDEGFAGELFSTLGRNPRNEFIADNLVVTALPHTIGVTSNPDRRG